MKQKRLKASDILGEKYYNYTLTASNYNPTPNTNITITCTVKNNHDKLINGKTVTLYQNGTSIGNKTTNNNGVATWTIPCNSNGLQRFNVEDVTVEVYVDNKQDKLVSGTSLKTINNTSLLGSGNITLTSGGNDFSGSYNDLTDKPSYTPSVTSTTSGSYKIGSINISGTDVDIYGKDTNTHQSLTNYVTNDDSRLSDSRTPTSHTHTKSDVTDFPTIPSKISDLTDDSTFIKKSSTVGLVKNNGTIDTNNYSTFTGDYTDLTNKPSIPSASSTTPSADTNNGSVGTGTTWARSNHTHPKSSIYAESTHTHTKTQITDFPAIPSKTSDLTNDSNFLTSHQDISGKEDKTNKVSSWSSTVNNTHYPTEKLVKDTIDTKQDTLVSGTTIKTINNNSLLGSGNISISGDSSVDIATTWSGTPSDSKVPSEKLTYDNLNLKVPKTTSLISTDNIDNLTGANDVGLYVLNDNVNIGGTLPITGRAFTLLVDGDTKTRRQIITYYKDANNTYTSRTFVRMYSGYSSNYGWSSWKELAFKDNIPSDVSDLTDNSNTPFTPKSHTHTTSQITNFPTVPSKTSDLTNDGADGTNVFVANDDSRLSDARTPKSHTHGNLTDDGKIGSNANYFVYTTTDGLLTSKQKIGNINYLGRIGSTANLPIITTTNGALTTGSFGTSANTFCEGNDSRLSDARTPTSHTHEKTDISDFAHTHGNITGDGRIGNTGGLLLVTTNNGAITVASSYAHNHNAWTETALDTRATLFVNTEIKLCELRYVRSFSSATAGTLYSWGAGLVPSDYRPSAQVQGIFDTNGVLIVTSDGDIKGKFFEGWSGTSTLCTGSVMWHY